MYYDVFLNSAKDSYNEYLDTLDVIDYQLPVDIKIINRIYSALLISLYATFESHLLSLCDLLEETGLMTIKVSELSGNNYIDKALTYFGLTGYLTFNKKDLIWKEIQSFQSIRNLIAHNQMNVVELPKLAIKKQRLFSLISSHHSFMFDDVNGDFQIIESSYLRELAEKCRDLTQLIGYNLERKRTVVRNRTLPYDMTAWGIEKTEALLGNAISLMNLRASKISQAEIDEFREGTIHSSLWNLTKLFALFHDGEWSTSDPEIIIQYKEKGIQMLIDKYKNQ